MNSMQIEVLREYKRVSGDVTISAISKDTGIQRTRVYRILSGSEMRLGEYAVFKSRIQEMGGEVKNEAHLLRDCVATVKIDGRAIKDFRHQIERKVELRSLVNSVKGK